MVKRHVSAEEYDSAFADQDNRRVMRAVGLKFRRYLDEDDLHGCAMRALWRALQGHDAEYGQKFTTSLHRFMAWECINEFRRSCKVFTCVPASLTPQRVKMDESVITETWSRRRTDTAYDRVQVEHLFEQLDALPAEQRRLVDDYYFGGYRLREMADARGTTKETVRRQLRQALDALAVSLGPE